MRRRDFLRACGLAVAATPALVLAGKAEPAPARLPPRVPFTPYEYLTAQRLNAEFDALHDAINKCSLYYNRTMRTMDL